MEDWIWEKIYLDPVTRFVRHHPIISAILIFWGIVILMLSLVE